MRKRKEEQPISLHNLQHTFQNRESEMYVIVNTNISAYEYVNDVLSYHYIINKNGRRENVVVPVFIPCSSFDTSKSSRDRELLKKYKSEWKRSNSGRKLESVKVS